MKPISYKTKPNFKWVVLLIFITTLIPNVKGQRNSVSGGGKAVGVGGELFYTVGQIDYTTVTATNIALTQGVQQPFEIFILLGINFDNVELTTSVFPNPTTDFITLHLSDISKFGYKYLITDAKGSLIHSGKLVESETKINLSEFCAGIYYVKITENSNDIKVYKIVKHD